VTIRFSKYVRITSGVGGNAAVRQRDLIGRVFSSAAILSPDSIIEFADANSVGEYFGFESDEYARAAFYFSYISATLGVPQRIGYALYSPTGNGAGVFGDTSPALLSQLVLATAGGLVVNIDGTAYPVTGADMSGAASLSDIASEVTSAIQAASADPAIANATVTYDAIAGRFVFSTNYIANQTATITSNSVGVNDLAAALGLRVADGAVSVAGTDPQTPAEAFAASEAVSNNFGSFVFTDALSLSEHETVAAANAGKNVMYQYMVPVLRADASTWGAALAGYQGTGVTLSPIAGEYPEMFPMVQLAATNYDRRGAVSTYMFKSIGGLTATVTTDAESDALDALRVNYYGNTQTAGQVLSFYQRGVLMGGPTAPLDMNVYANEQWLKDHAAAGIMSLLTSTGRVPANDSGRGQLLTVLQDSIDAALLNGTISVGRTFTAQQRAYITTITGDPLAWHQVQNAGYWVDVRIVPSAGPGGTTEYKAVYTLLYAKDDAIRFVDGAHSLV